MRVNLPAGRFCERISSLLQRKGRKNNVLLIVGDKFTQQKTLRKRKKFGKNQTNRKMGTSKFDIADYLDSMEEGDNAAIINAIRHIAKAMGMTKISEETGLSRPSL